MRKLLSKKSLLVCLVLMVALLFTACVNKKNIDAELQGQWGFVNNNFMHVWEFDNGTYTMVHINSLGDRSESGTYEIDTRHSVIRCFKADGEEGYVFDYTYNTDSGELRLSWNGNSYVRVD